MYHVRKAAVLGSGVMGASIAAHLANTGIPVILLDIVPRDLNEDEKKKGLTLEDRKVRNRVADSALKKLLKQKPAPLTVPENLNRIETGNLSDDLDRLKEADWIIEVIIENLEIKQKLFADVDEHRRPGTVVSSNTSGISINSMMEGRSADFKEHFLGTHFFNPPRYLKLLEVIPSEETSPDVLEFMKNFGEESLGKGVVVAKDTPNFIANRIGTYGLQMAVRLLDKGYSIGEIDSVTGPLIGRPKSATFRTLDVVGLDTYIHVADNVRENVSDQKEKDVFVVPEFMKKMRDNGWIGSKSGQGFYLKTKEGILQLNPETMDYEPREKVKSGSVQAARQMKTTRDKIKALAYADDRAGEIIWPLLKDTLLYSAGNAYEIADNIEAVDLAMKWGFGWEMGPFEVWDALGVEKAVNKMKAEGDDVPGWVMEMMQNGSSSFYKEESGERFFYHDGAYQPVTTNPKAYNLRLLKKNHEVAKNSGASLVDLGDDVLGLEFHSPNNAIGVDIMQMIQKGVKEAEQNYKGLVIGNQGSNFCVGANLALMLMEAQDDNFFEIDNVIRQFQTSMMLLKYADVPVVAAPHNMTLGGGAEVCLATDSIHASPETYMGLVEVGVGLIPGGGGNKELYLRHLDQVPNGVHLDLTAVTNQVFETIATAKVSTSGEEAVKNGFLTDKDSVGINDSFLLHDAKQKVLYLHSRGYRAPQRKKIKVSGEAGYAAMVMGAKTMNYSGYASDHDVKIARHLAKVLSGGFVPQGTEVEEQYLLDLEREAFLSLIGEPKTQQRMQHMLVKGKPLRN